MNRFLKGMTTYGVIIVAALLLAANYHIFIVENHFTPAGIGGIATMVQYKTGFNIGFLTLLVNIPLCAVAFFIVNRAYAVRSFVFTLIYSVSYYLMDTFGSFAVQYDAHGNDTIFPAIISGVITGLVIGMCIKYGLSTGGTEIVAQCVHVYKPETNFFIVNFTMNAAIALISLFVYSEAGALDYKPVALCITYCFVSNFVANYIIKGTKTAYKFTVITTHPAEISREVTHILRHGVTKIAAEGAYTGADKTVLLCVVNKHQLVDFKDIIDRYDDTFSFCETVNETYGNFYRLKRKAEQTI